MTKKKKKICDKRFFQTTDTYHIKLRICIKHVNLVYANFHYRFYRSDTEATSSEYMPMMNHTNATEILYINAYVNNYKKENYKFIYS